MSDIITLEPDILTDRRLSFASAITKVGRGYLYALPIYNYGEQHALPYTW